MNKFELYKYWKHRVVHVAGGDLSTFKLFMRFYKSDEHYRVHVDRGIAFARRDDLAERLYLNTSDYKGE